MRPGHLHLHKSERDVLGLAPGPRGDSLEEWAKARSGKVPNNSVL